jgi:tyrosyl-tRNA synthetase
MGQDPQIGFFMPLLVGLDGVKKMSKSLGNYVGISEAPDAMFGKLMSIRDDMMASYFELCTDVPLDEVAALLDAAQSGRTNPKDVKRRLAREVVTIYHGADAALAADAEFERVHARHETPVEIPEYAIDANIVKDGRVWICRLLVAAGLARSTGEARRLVEQNGVQLDGAKITSAAQEFDPAALNGRILKVGALNYRRITHY